MRTLLFLLSVSLMLHLAGCAGERGDKRQSTGTGSSRPGDGQPEEAAIHAALAHLAPEDRKLAEEQRWCAVNTKNRLGSMETPAKVTINSQTVFLCCNGCEKSALADPDKTLASVKELKQKAASSRN